MKKVLTVFLAFLVYLALITSATSTTVSSDTNMQTNDDWSASLSVSPKGVSGGLSGALGGLRVRAGFHRANRRSRVRARAASFRKARLSLSERTALAKERRLKRRLRRERKKLGGMMRREVMAERKAHRSDPALISAKKKLLAAELRAAKRDFERSREKLKAMIARHKKHVMTSRHLRVKRRKVDPFSRDGRNVFWYTMGLHDPRHRPRPEYLHKRTMEEVYTAHVEKAARARARKLISRYYRQMFGRRKKQTNGDIYHKR